MAVSALMSGQDPSATQIEMDTAIPMVIQDLDRSGRIHQLSLHLGFTLTLPLTTIQDAQQQRRLLQHQLL